MELTFILLGLLGVALHYLILYFVIRKSINKRFQNVEDYLSLMLICLTKNKEIAELEEKEYAKRNDASKVSDLSSPDIKLAVEEKLKRFEIVKKMTNE